MSVEALLILGALDSITRLALARLPDFPEGEMTPEMQERLVQLVARLTDLHAQVMARRPAHPID